MVYEEREYLIICLSKESRKQHRVDYMFVHGETIGRAMQKYVAGKFIFHGSLKNNTFPRTENSIPNTVALISTFRSKYTGISGITFER